MMIAASNPALSEFASDLVNVVWGTPLFFLLLGCGLLFSAITKFVQWRIVIHGISCVRGKYDRPEDVGAINHFQALCAALSATIGLGNIAGVAVAVSIGGPGAVFWMWVIGLFGMALKFTECTLAVMYRDSRDVPDPSAPALTGADAEARTLEYEGEEPPLPGAKSQGRGEVRGGPMWYIQKALVDPLKAKGSFLWVVFKVLAVCFAIATVLNSFGGGNMYQGWNVANVLEDGYGIDSWLSAVVVSALVAMVIIGGIKRIGLVAAALVPFMCIVYVAGALIFVFVHSADIPRCMSLIVQSAFTPAAEGGAFAGVSVWYAFTWGMKRACFSNEAGEGSAPIVHAAAKTDEPVREGVVAGLEPLIDTLIICTMTGLVLLMSGAWNRPALGTVESVEGDVVRVAVNPDVPANLADLYYHAVSTPGGADIAVHVKRPQGQEPVLADGQLEDLATAEGVDGWASVQSFALNMASLREEYPERVDKIEVGQPVHLDITGAKLTGFAFDTTLPGFGSYFVTLAVCLFAFSTMISWSYYGEKGAEYLLGPGAILPYKFLFVIFVFLGMILDKFSTVYDFSDATTGLMVLCNLPALLILSPHVVRATRSYFRRLDKGEMKTYR